MKRRPPDGRQESGGFIDYRCPQFGRKFVTRHRGHVRDATVEEGFIPPWFRPRVYMLHSRRGGGSRHGNGVTNPGILFGGSLRSRQRRRRLPFCTLRFVHSALV